MYLIYTILFISDRTYLRLTEQEFTSLPLDVSCIYTDDCTCHLKSLNRFIMKKRTYLGNHLK